MTAFLKTLPDFARTHWMTSETRRGTVEHFNYSRSAYLMALLKLSRQW